MYFKPITSGLLVQPCYCRRDPGLHGWKKGMWQSEQFGLPNSAKATNHSGRWCNPSWTKEELTGTRLFRILRGVLAQPSHLSHHPVQTPGGNGRARHRSVSSHIAETSRIRLQEAVHRRWRQAQPQWLCEMERCFVQISTKAVAAAKDHPVLRVSTNVPKSFGMADPVGCYGMEPTTVETLDGAPMVMRRHHLEKALATIVVDQMVDTRRQPGLNHWHPVR